ncbi:MAG: MoxR family ATPase [Planctomycetota bacterium]|nr:MoxR family ATPase [Planctomycetota bacterium]
MPEVSTNLVEDIAWARHEINKLRERLGAVVLEQGQAVDSLLETMLSGGHALLVGVPGVAKTLLCRALAYYLDLQFTRVQFTPDLLPGDITGSEFFDGMRMEWNVNKGPIFTQLFLADEINRAPAKIQSALLEAMQEGQVTLGGKSIKLPTPFMVIATQNPVEMEGVYPLPEAQQDRFLTRIDIGYPPALAEARMAMANAVNHNHTETGAAYLGIGGDSRPILDSTGVTRMQVARSKVVIDERLALYSVNLAQATREASLVGSHRILRLGAGPRATQAMLLMAQAHSLMRGGYFVLPEDIQAVAPGVFRHRLIPDDSLGWGPSDLNGYIVDLLNRVAIP